MRPSGYATSEIYCTTVNTEYCCIRKRSSIRSAEASVKEIVEALESNNSSCMNWMGRCELDAVLLLLCAADGGLTMA